MPFSASMRFRLGRPFRRSTCRRGGGRTQAWALRIRRARLRTNSGTPGRARGGRVYWFVKMPDVIRRRSVVTSCSGPSLMIILRGRKRGWRGRLLSGTFPPLRSHTHRMVAPSHYRDRLRQRQMYFGDRNSHASRSYRILNGCRDKRTRIDRTSRFGRRDDIGAEERRSRRRRVSLLNRRRSRETRSFRRFTRFR